DRPWFGDPRHSGGRRRPQRSPTSAAAFRNCLGFRRCAGCLCRNRQRLAAGNQRDAHARCERVEEGLNVAIPVVYNFRSVRARWTSAIVAVVGIAGTVGVFVAMLSLARGFKATLVASGSEDNAIIMRAGATSEMTGGVTIDTLKIIQDKPGIAQSSDGPLL